MSVATGLNPFRQHAGDWHEEGTPNARERRRDGVARGLGQSVEEEVYT
jgi:hypothetical protein